MWYRTEFELDCEQAFGRAGNWGEGKAKRALSSLPFLAIFSPNREPVHRLNLSQVYCLSTYLRTRKIPFNALVFTLRSKVADLIWTRANRPVIAQSVQFSKIAKNLNIIL